MFPLRKYVSAIPFHNIFTFFAVVQVMDEGADEFGKFLQAKYVANECESPDYYNGCTYPFETAENLIQVSLLIN